MQVQQTGEDAGGGGDEMDTAPVPRKAARFKVQYL